MDKDCVFDVDNALATDDLKEAVLHHQELSHHLCGVFAPDELIHHHCKGRYPRLHIVNTDESTGKGKHWLVYIRHQPKIVKVFDSYGMPPHFYSKDLWQYFLKVSKNGQLYVHSIRYQAIDTAVCGFHALFFICKHTHSKRHALPLVVKAVSFSKALENDRRVMIWGLSQFKNLVHLCANRRQSSLPWSGWR